MLTYTHGQVGVVIIVILKHLTLTPNSVCIWKILIYFTIGCLDSPKVKEIKGQESSSLCCFCYKLALLSLDLYRLGMYLGVVRISGR